MKAQLGKQTGIALALLATLLATLLAMGAFSVGSGAKRTPSASRSISPNPATVMPGGNSSGYYRTVNDFAPGWA